MGGATERESLALPGTAHRCPDSQAVRLPPVLMYHSISPSVEPDPHQIRVHPRRLDRQLRLLRALRLRGVSLSELVAAHDEGRSGGLVGLTFDDGYTDFLEHAVPVLARHGMTATLYVVAGRLGGQNGWDVGPRLSLVNAAQVRAVRAAGHEIGSHTTTHVRLSGADPSTLVAEVAESKWTLEELLGEEVRSFCYPWGDFDGPAAEAVRAVGYDHGCVTGDYSPGDRFTIPRCYVAPHDTPLHLAARLARHHWRVRRP